MKSRSYLLVLVLLSLALPAAAESVSCPDLARAVQVAPCPPEDELRYTFTAYCADNARMYGKEAENCADFAAYRRIKNLALWESGDGAFHSYLNCEPPVVDVTSVKPVKISVVRKGTLTQVVCGYGEGVSFTYRTKAACKVVEADCASSGGCKATCD